MIPRPDLVPETECGTLEIYQLTTEETIPSSHIYMEAQIFTPDSKRFVLHRSATPHGSDRTDPEHRYLLCDAETGDLTLTDETGATAPSISPDGRHLYYFIDETAPTGGRLTLKRVGLDGSDRRIITVLEGSIPGTSYHLSRPYPLSTISSDGNRLAISGFLGDGNTSGAPWGLLVFDLASDEIRLILEGPSWCNIHPQYSRSLAADASHDLLVQENHGNECDPSGAFTKLVGGNGADIHVIRDDGTDFRNMPWGRDGNEFCQGHQCWIGRSESAITSTGTREPREAQLIEGRAAPHADHVGLATPDGWRNDLSRSFESPAFYHFATDIDGARLITDSGPQNAEGSVYLFDLPREDGLPLSNARKVAVAGSSWVKDTHIHPFLSPDGRAGFFNSDASGILQAYTVRGWT